MLALNRLYQILEAGSENNNNPSVGPMGSENKNTNFEILKNQILPQIDSLLQLAIKGIYIYIHTYPDNPDNPDIAHVIFTLMITLRM